MEEENPINTYEFHKHNNVTMSNNKNVPGRPLNCKSVKFNEQPKSIIALMLLEEKKVHYCDEIVDYTITQANPSQVKNRLQKNSCKPQSEKTTKIFSCTYSNCTYSTKISSNLNKHKRTHTNEKLYLCDRCTFRTKFSNSLNVHKRLHSNEKPFYCRYCEYRCNSSSNLKKHNNHKHSKNKS